MGDSDLGLILLPPFDEGGVERVGTREGLPHAGNKRVEPRSVTLRLSLAR